MNVQVIMNVQELRERLINTICETIKDSPERFTPEAVVSAARIFESYVFFGKLTVEED